MQILQAFSFYSVVTACAGIGLPVMLSLGANSTLAYLAAKPVGLLLFGYGVWVLSSFRILDYQQTIFITAIFFLTIVAGIILSKRMLRRRNQGAGLRPKDLFSWEAISLLSYCLYLWVRTKNPAVNGTEQFMDMALLSAAGKTHFFPFIDPWYADKTVNYYYYGSYLMSLVSNLANVPYTIAYNLSLGILFCQAVILVAVLTREITGSNRAAAAAAYLVTTAGTVFFAATDVGALFAETGQVYSFVSASRLFNPAYIINEIPSYSFTVGDLHAHLIGLPFFLNNLILMYVLANMRRPRAPFLVLLAVSFASSGMINAWDFVTLACVLIVIALLKAIVAEMTKEEPAKRRRAASVIWVSSVIGVLCLAVALMSPALRSFEMPVLGLGFTPSFVDQHHLHDVQYPTPFSAFCGLWGIFLSGVAGAWFVLRKELRAYVFLLAISIVSFGILIGVEIFFIKDIYSVTNPRYFRANTTFKFGYHAWTMLAIAFVALCSHWYKWSLNSAGNRWLRETPAALMVSAVVAGLVYPAQALDQFYFSKSVQSGGTLDGADWMRVSMPEDLDTIRYIDKNVGDRVIVAEAVGDSYSLSSRITTYTGMETPMGWKTHEWTWRFQAQTAESAASRKGIVHGWSAIAQITADIQRLYDTPSVQTAMNVIRSYGISYIYVGSLERKTYPRLQMGKFYSLGQVVYQSGTSTLFVIRADSFRQARVPGD